MHGLTLTAITVAEICTVAHNLSQSHWNMKSMLWSQSILKEYVKVNYYNIGFDIGNYHFNREKHFAVNLLTHGQTSKSLEH